jgi:hypothetical protein
MAYCGGYFGIIDGATKHDMGEGYMMTIFNYVVPIAQTIALKKVDSKPSFLRHTRIISNIPPLHYAHTEAAMPLPAIIRTFALAFFYFWPSIPSGLARVSI